MWKSIRDAEMGPGFSSLAGLKHTCSQKLLVKLRLERELEGHLGCTNTVSFNSDGNVLLSGSDDLSIRLWSWQSGRQLLKITPGHHNNIFQAYALPHSNDSTILSCAADGQVRVSTLDGSRCTSKKIGSHDGRAHKLSLLPDNPASTFLSTGEDGVVMHYDLRTKPTGPIAKLSVTEGVSRLPVELNAVHANPCRPWLFAVGGGDPYARIFDIRHIRQSSDSGPCAVAKLCPTHLRRILAEPAHITCVQYSRFGELLATYNDEDIYLFDAAGAGGQELPMASQMQGSGPTLEVGDASDEEDQDTRASARDEERRAAEVHALSSAQASRARGQQRTDFVLQRFSGHRNSQTVKGVSFYGALDEYVISGSDCGNIFCWRKKDGELLRLLKGDAWVVNCLTPHPWQPLVLATSGIENSIKIWSPTSEDARPQDVEVLKEVMEDNAARRQRAARRVVIPPQMLLALLTGRREERARVREREAEDSGNESSQSSEEEGQELAEGVMMARLRRLLLQRISGGDFMGLEGEAPEDSEEDEEEDEEDDDNPSWNRFSGSGSDGSEREPSSGCGGSSTTSGDGDGDGDSSGGRREHDNSSSSSSSSSGSEDRGQTDHDRGHGKQEHAGGRSRRGEEQSKDVRGGKRAKPNDD